MKSINLLETTLRDGSYVINYQFNHKDTEIIAGILDEIGFEYIEIGPGTGLNTKSKADIEPASSDIDYITSARKSVKNGKIGMFFIPGIGRKKDIDIASENGLDFLRCGVNINQYKELKDYVPYAKKKGLTVTSNLMKSYIVPAKEFSYIANEVHNYGVDIVYLVDSSGGMFPDEVEEYIKCTLDKNPDINFGFHGHNNLDMSMANTLRAISSGASFVDSTIRGMGRSSGNTNTEKLVLILEKMGYDLPIDKKKLFQLSENIIKPFLSNKFESSTDLILGIAQFHSSFLKYIHKYAEKYNIDPHDLIIEYSKIDKASIDETVLEKKAKEISLKGSKKVFDFNISHKITYDSDSKKQIEVLKKNFTEEKYKFNSPIYFNISKVYDSSNSEKISPVIHRINKIVFGSAEVKCFSKAQILMRKLSGSVDEFLIDDRLINNEGSTKNTNQMIIYNDPELIARSLVNLSNEIAEKDGLENIEIDIYDEIKSEFFKLTKNKVSVYPSNDKNAQIFIAGKRCLRFEELMNYKKLKWIIVASPGAINKSVSENENWNLIRLDPEMEIYNYIMLRKGYQLLLNHKYGVIRENGKIFCSGGYIGKKGVFIVDDINNIKEIYGISNGDGSIDYLSKGE